MTPQETEDRYQKFADTISGVTLVALLALLGAIWIQESIS